MSSASSSTRSPPGITLSSTHAIANVTTNEYTSVASTATQLVAEQPEAAAVQEHPVAARGVDRLVGEEAEQQRADDPADEVHADDVERVVEAQHELQVHRRSSRRRR